MVTHHTVCALVDGPPNHYGRMSVNWIVCVGGNGMKNSTERRKFELYLVLLWLSDIVKESNLICLAIGSYRRDVKEQPRPGEWRQVGSPHTSRDT